LPPTMPLPKLDVPGSAGDALIGLFVRLRAGI
jgi:hypothetical protein